jgi:hypothetical protein
LLNDEFDLPIISQRNIIPCPHVRFYLLNLFCILPQKLQEISVMFLLVTLPATRYHITKSMLAQLGLVYGNRMVISRSVTASQ